jgi:hypothetical protein
MKAAVERVPRKPGAEFGCGTLGSGNSSGLEQEKILALCRILNDL